MTLSITHPLPAGEWARDPAPLREEAYRDGWLQRLGGRPRYYLRYLTDVELAAWDAGHAAGRRALVLCVRPIGEPLQPAGLGEDSPPPEPAGVPFVQLAPGPPAPSFDGSQICAQVDPELFFPKNGARGTEAKKLCAGCEFLNPCRRYAMTTRIDGMAIEGVWGGTTFADRRRLHDAAAGGELEQVDVDVDEDVAS
jgi:WhiB family redox-sensing transcriptional regulator